MKPECKTPPAVSKTLLTERQMEILKLRGKGLTQKEVAKTLRTSRENISILEKHAYRNIRRAKATLEALNELRAPSSVTIRPGTALLDVPRIVLGRADEMNLKMKSTCVDILEEVKSKSPSKVRCKRVIRPITVTILLDGTIFVE